MASDEREAPDVELSFLVKQRIVDVLLQYHGALALAVLADQRLYFWEFLFDFDSSSPVRVLARFDDPNVLPALLLLLLVKVLLEPTELRVVLAGLDVEGEGQGIKDILFPAAAVGVVVAHVDEQSLLVVQVLVEL